MLNASILGLLRKAGVTFPNRAEPTAPPPLSFDRVNGGRPVTSQTQLFQLPMELVQEVVAYLDTADLKSLAFVDRDCRLLAQSRLFATVVLDYSSAKWQLLDELSREAQVRQIGSGVSESLSIGACIRHLTVQTNSREMRSRHEVELVDIDNGLTGAKQEEVVGSYSGAYLPAIARALHLSLPNLIRLEWRDYIPIPQHMLRAFASSPVQHLGLQLAMLGSGCEYPVLPLEQRQKWALRSLDLLLQSDPDYNQGGWPRVDRFCRSFLKEVAPTLEKLSCYGSVFAEDCVIYFPRLHTLWLCTQVTGDSALESFFPAGAAHCALRSVTIFNAWADDRQNTRVWKFLAKRGHIRGLEVLNLRFINPNDKIPIIAFLSANVQLKSLLILRGKPKFLDTTIFPFLASNLKSLTSLVVGLPSTEISSSHLVAIGQITSLTSLWIADTDDHWTAGTIARNPPDITALSPLRNLTHLALSAKDFLNPAALARQSLLGPANYWATTNPEGQLRLSELEEKLMRKVVEGYATAIRSLKWVYIGELVKTVVGNGTMLEEDRGTRMYCSRETSEGPV